MPRCVTNWEQRTLKTAAAGKAMHIHETVVGGTARRRSSALFPPRTAMNVRTESPRSHVVRAHRLDNGGNAQQHRKPDTTVASFSSLIARQEDTARADFSLTDSKMEDFSRVLASREFLSRFPSLRKYQLPIIRR